MHEVEIRFDLRNVNVQDVKNKILEEGGELVEKVKIEDLSFNSEYRNFWDTVECLRIRTINNEKSTLTYKPSGKKENEVMAVEEYEVEIDKPEVMKEILFQIGFKPLEPVGRIVKEREKYELNNYTIVFDTFKNMGTFLEIEKMVKDEKRVEEVKKALKEQGEKIGLTEKNLLRKSIGFVVKEILEEN